MIEPEPYKNLDVADRSNPGERRNLTKAGILALTASLILGPALYKACHEKPEERHVQETSYFLER